MADTAEFHVIKQPVRSVPALLRLGSQQQDTMVMFMDRNGNRIPYVQLLNMTVIQLMHMIGDENLWIETKI